MPLYEYRCTSCSHRFEVLQRVGEGAEGLICAGCGRPTLEKQHSTFAAVAGGRGSEALPACGEGACCGGLACAR
jgi:putative FmdB family regulatory protein